MAGEMKPGKIPAELLRSRVLAYTGVRRDDVLVHAALGEDSAVIDFGEEVCVLSSDPITGAGQEVGWFAVHIACNDVASNGATPVGVLLTILAPPDSSLDAVEEVMTSADRACRELGIEILGGHTEVTADLPALIVSTTAVGRAPKDKLVTSAGVLPGDDIVLTKGAGLEGTAILAMDFAERLRGRVEEDILERAAGLLRRLSVVPEALVARELGVHAMHDVTEGGVLGAVYEMAEAAGVGVEIWREAIPLLPETGVICQALEVDPLRLIGSGAMLMATDDGRRLVQELERAGIEARVIGRALGSTYRVLLPRPGASSSEAKAIEPPAGDELWRLLEALKE